MEPQKAHGVIFGGNYCVHSTDYHVRITQLFPVSQFSLRRIS